MSGNPAGGRTTGDEVRALQASAMSEEQVARAVRDACAAFGVLRFHVPDSRWMAAGWPDEALIGPRGVIFRELKTAKGRVRPEQATVLDRMGAAGLDVGLWRPGDVLSGAIVAQIRAIGRVS